MTTTTTTTTTTASTVSIITLADPDGPNAGVGLNPPWPATWTAPTRCPLTAADYAEPNPRVFLDYVCRDKNTLSCYPPRESDAGNFPGFYAADTLTECPRGWVLQGSPPVTVVGTEQRSLVWRCCSSGYTLDGPDGYAYQCTRFITDATEVYTLESNNFTPPTAMVTVSSKIAIAWAVRAIMKSTATSTDLSESNTPSETNTARPTDSAVPQPNTGLSTGAKAGIGVGVALAVIAAAGFAFLFCRRRARRQRGVPNIPEADGKPLERAYTAELPASTPEAGKQHAAELPVPNHAPPAELYGGPQYETAAMPPVYETAEIHRHGHETEATPAGPPEAGSRDADPVSPVGRAATPPNATPSPASAGGNQPELRGAIVDLELQWLEEEEARLRERKERLMVEKARGS